MRPPHEAEVVCCLEDCRIEKTGISWRRVDAEAARHTKVQQLRIAVRVSKILYSQIGCREVVLCILNVPRSVYGSTERIDGASADQIRIANHKRQSASVVVRVRR